MTSMASAFSRCGHCKRMKPDYQAAATEVKGKAVMAAMDLNKGNNMPVKSAYNISGFPTLIYFEGGQQKFGFNGKNRSEDESFSGCLCDILGEINH